MKTNTCRVIRLCAACCAVLMMSDPPLNADEPPAEATQLKARTVRLALEGRLAKDTDLVLLEMAGQTDSLLGINVKPVDEVLRSHLGLAEGKGLVITVMADDSPAAKAGLAKNDVLLSVAGKDVSDLEMLSQSLREPLDKAVKLGVISEGKKLIVEVRPEHLQTARLNAVVTQQAEEPKYRLGVGLADADETLRSQLSLPGGEGLVVTSVQTDSPAAKAGVLVNDVLIKLDGKALASIEALAEQLQTIGDKSVSLELLRRGQPATLTVTPDKNAPEQVLSVTFPQANPNLESVPLYTYSVNQLAFPVWNSSVYTVPDPNSLPGDPASRVANLLQQVKQLQASIEALEAAIKSQPQPAEKK